MTPMLCEIQAAAMQYFGLGRGEFNSLSRERRIARPRQIFMFLARELTIRSLPEIGKSLGGMDHTTILHGVRNIKALQRTIPEVARDVRGVRELSYFIASQREKMMREAA